MKLHKFQIHRSQRSDGVRSSYLDSIPSPYHIFDFWQKIRPTPTPPPQEGGKPRKSNKNLKNRKFWFLLQFRGNIISRRIFGCWIRFWPLETILSTRIYSNRPWMERKSEIWWSGIPQAELWKLLSWWGFGMKFAQQRSEMMFFGLPCFLTQTTICLQAHTAHWLCSCQISPKIEFQNFQIGIFASKNYQKYFLLKILKTTINGSNLSKYELPTPSGSWDRSILLNRKPDFGKSEMSNVKKKNNLWRWNGKSRYLRP